MSRFTTVQIAAVGSGVFPSSKFQNDGSLPAFGQTSLGGTGGNGGESAALPAMYIVAPITRDWAFGLGIGVPFGLETRWDDGWLGRYQALQSKIETPQREPVDLVRINDQFTPRRRRQLAAHQGDVHQQRATIPRRSRMPRPDSGRRRA
jgi:long-chain fatty acid transport protein